MKKIFYTLMAVLCFSGLQAQDFVIFDWNNTPMTGNNISGLHAADGGSTIWIASNQGTARFNTGSGWAVDKLPLNGTLPNFLSSVEPDQNGKLYAGAFQNGISSYSGGAWTNESMGNVKDIHVDSINQIWGASADAGLLFYDGSTWTNFRTNNTGGFNSDVVNCVTDDGKGLLYVGFDAQGNWQGGMATYDGTNWVRWSKTLNNLPSDHVNRIAFKANGDLVLATDIGIVEGDGTNWTIYNTANSSIPSNTVNSVAIDDNGLMWVGTETGFATFDGTTWTVFNTSNSALPDNRVRDIVFDNSGHTWMATGNGVVVYKAGGASVNIDEPLWAQQLSFAIAPNQVEPSSGLNYQVDLPQAEILQLSVLDMKGQLVLRTAAETQMPGLHQESLALPNLSSGIYFARLQVGNVIRTEKFIVH